MTSCMEEDTADPVMKFTLRETKCPEKKIHDNHDTTEMRLALRKKREELEYMLSRHLDDEQDLEKGLADTTSFIQLLRKRVEEEKADLVQKFGELAEKAERRKMLAENRIEEEMKVRITSLESRLRELADLKSKTGLKIAACFELVNLKNDDPRIFLMKFKNLQQEFGARTGNYIEQKVLTDCASSILFDRLKSDIISNAMKDFCPSVRRRQIPAIIDISPKPVNMTIEITNVQIVGTISAEVEWLSLNEAVIYQVDYSCRPDETVVLNDVTESRCRLTNLRWDSTYTVNVTMQLLNGSRVTFDKQRFKTDPEVKCFPLAIREICDDKVQVMDSLDEFIASTRIPNNISYIQKEEFHGIVFAPALREERQFWTMNIDLTIFEKWCDDETFLEFGIVDYSHIDDCSSLSIGHNTYSCSISKKTKKTFHIQFHDSSFRNDHSRELALKLYQKTHFSYGFLYDRLNSEFAIMDCQSRELLHVFFNVQFEEEHNVIFAICTFHTKLKMRLSTKLDYMHCNMENVSYWMRKINSFKTDHLDSTSPSLSD